MKVKQEDILEFNELYFKLKNYSEVARQTGFSVATVRKYVDKNYQPVEQANFVKFQGEISTELPQLLIESDEWGKYFKLTPEEEKLMPELWKELNI